MQFASVDINQGEAAVIRPPILFKSAFWERVADVQVLPHVGSTPGGGLSGTIWEESSRGVCEMRVPTVR